MFAEPLMDMLRIHGEKFNDRLVEIRDNLASIVQNTEAQVAVNRWVNRSVPVGKKAVEQLRNNEAYGWLIRDVAATVEAEVFINTQTGDGFVCKLKAGERDNVHWYVPRGSVVFVKNLEEKEGFVNFHLESLVASAKKASTGSSEEHVDTPRDPTLPSGHPLRI